MSKYNVIVYDCDGVIADSGLSILSYYDGIMKRCGLPPIDWSEEALRLKAFYMAGKDILEYFAKGDKDLYQKMLNAIKNDEENKISFDDTVLETGLIEGLEIVKSKNIPMAVFTNRGKSLYQLLEHFHIGNFFSMLVTSHDVSLPKPSPEGLLKICENFGTTPENILFIGDSLSDYEAAKSCGANFLAFKKPLFDSPVIDDHRLIINYI